MALEHAPGRTGNSAVTPSALRIGHTIEPVARSEGVSAATIRRWVREGRFPKPVKHGRKGGRCIWYDEQLQAWRAEQIAKANGAGADAP